jgi:Domain of unknown function (DUF4145)
MKCPHCTNGFHESWSSINLGNEQPSGVQGGIWWLHWMTCPECGECVGRLSREAHPGTGRPTLDFIAWPQSAARPVAKEVEQRFADDFQQAAATLSISPKASAALSRRCLQDILREKAGVKPSNLDSEIQEVIDAGKTPSWLTDNLDAVRVVGNFAAHPIKSTNTGEVVDVEPGEAAFLLDVLEAAFDFYFVQPEKAREHRNALNAKLAEAGKPSLKPGS